MNYMEEVQKKLFKSNIEEAITCDDALILRNAVADFLKNKFEKEVMDAIIEEEEYVDPRIK